ncbi:hypothetical protein A9507_05835 [Methanobacterium sp. A39]|uniref:DUF421 domain-containing protein n=2 Tax=Methanobacteriaceae TaxID=2159 RepID=A0A2A2H2P1_METBR|nr:hypothetical protein A9507_05835 [Methanobacterium sp. A39]PAV03594.1 hypothetical protein ASJ80_00565 [Methanobacterium bryantii]
MWYFQNWNGVLRVLLVGIPMYFILVFMLRISGKRTLSKMNQFDFVITIAFGSTIASILLSSTVSLAEGVTALALLIFLQFIVTWTSVRSSKIDKLVKSEPKLLFYRGNFLKSAMKSERVTESEIYSTMRNMGINSIEDVDTVIIETNGSLSIISQISHNKTPPP